MINSSMRYYVAYTSLDKSPISISRSSLISDIGDITLIGKNRAEYGETFNNNTLHLLENFATPEDPNNKNFPLLNSTLSPLLRKPTLGQIWFNKTQQKSYVWNGKLWLSMDDGKSVAGNSGVIYHGSFIPRPVMSGYTFPYSECSWVVSPFGFSESERVNFISCYTDSNGKLIMQYRNGDGLSVKNGYANYQIIGIRNTDSHGTPPHTPNIPGLTPTPTITPSITPSASTPVTPPPTPVSSRTPGPTRAASVTPTVTRTETPVPSVTRTSTPTPTPTPTITPSITASKPPPKYIDLYDQDVSGSELAGYRILTNSTIITYNKSSFSTPTRWIFNDDVANYSVRATLLSGNVTEGDVGSWLNCGINRDWNITGTGQCRFRIDIKRNVDDIIMSTCEVVLRALP